MYEEIKKLNSDEAKKLLLAFLLTDGDVRKIGTRKKIQTTFNGKDKCLHDLFVETMKKAFNRKPSAYLYKGKRCLRTTFEFSSNSTEIAEMFKLSPSFAMKRGYPTLKAILKGTKNLKIMSLRIAFSADGNVSVSNRKPRLRLGCSNPNLAKEWQKLAAELKIDMNISKDKNTWSGIQGLTTDKKNNLKKFLECGGFAPGCKAYKSKRFHLWEKNKILIHILDNPCSLGGL